MFDKGVKLVFDLGVRYVNKIIFFKGYKRKILIKIEQESYELARFIISILIVLRKCAIWI